MRCLVTGGAGFIGSHLAERLVQHGNTVRVLDNLSSGSLRNLAKVHDAIEFVEGDVRDGDAVSRAVEGCEVVFHLAAIASVVTCTEKPVESHEVNALGTLRLLEAARRAGVRRLVYTSSSAVYGDASEVPLNEESTGRILSPYAAQKLVGEHYCDLYSELHGLETVSLRYFNAYGPRQDPSSPYSGVISVFMRLFEEGKAPTIDGDGAQTRDFVFVEDVAKANWLAAEAELSRGRIFNVATGTRVSIAELASVLRGIAGGPAPIHGPARAGDVRHSQADISRARDVLGFEPEVSLMEGLTRTRSWYLDQVATADGAKSS